MRIVPIETAIEMVAQNPAWRGMGPKRKLDAVIFDPPPKPDPKWIAGYRNQHSTSIWINYDHRPHEA